MIILVVPPFRILRIFNCFCVPLICFVLMNHSAAEDKNPVDEIISKLYSGQTRAAAELIQKLTTIDSTSTSGSPIVVAMAQVPDLNDPALFEQVFKWHPNCNLRDKKGMTALYFAASAGNIDLVDRLIEAGADPNLVSDDYGSALIGASWNNRGAIARRLLVIPEIKVDSADRLGRTALIFAVIHGDLE